MTDVFVVSAGNGTIDRHELKTVLKSCTEESSLKLSEDALDDLTEALFTSVDEDLSGEISFEELLTELGRHPDIMENLTIGLVRVIITKCLKNVLSFLIL